MAEVLRQLSKMSREERLRIAHWILDSIANGEVVRPTREDDEAREVYDYLMGQSGWLAKDYQFDREEANAL